MNISIKTIPHIQQRYPTVGDWQWKGDDLEITVSSMNNWKYESLVALHELIEALLCKDRNISQTSVDAFDKQFEDMRAHYPDIVKDEEPGYNKHAPYFKEHIYASDIESDIADELGVDWDEYTQVVDEL